MARRDIARGHERTVRERDAQQRRLCASYQLPVLAGGRVTGAAVRTGIVGREERADDELAGFTDVTSLPTSSTMPQYSWPIGVGSLIGFMPRYGQRSEPQTQVTDSRMTASVDFVMAGMGRSSKRTSPGP
jgi:hypothetical protein